LLFKIYDHEFKVTFLQNSPTREQAQSKQFVLVMLRLCLASSLEREEDKGVDDVCEAQAC
jgi:hypothetical protein